MTRGLALLVASGLVVIGCGGNRPSGGKGEPSEATTVDVVPGGGDQEQVTLYFPGDDWFLVAEPRTLPRWETPLAGARAVLTELLAGPTSEALRAPLPAEVTLGTTYIAADGRLYVDLVSTEHDRPPESGSLTEMLSVYSLVDSVVLNIPEIESVVLLWNGRQPETFGGHVDTSLPLLADRDLLETPR